MMHAAELPFSDERLRYIAEGLEMFEGVLQADAQSSSDGDERISLADMAGVMRDARLIISVLAAGAKACREDGA